MTHRAETLLGSFATAVTGLATTGSRVQRGRAWPVPVLPALSIDMGEDRPVNSQPLSAKDRILTVFLTLHAEGAGNLETTINQMKTETYAALKADHTLGGNAMDLDLVVDGQPEIEEGDKPVMRCETQWQIFYRHSETSTEV